MPSFAKFSNIFDSHLLYKSCSSYNKFSQFSTSHFTHKVFGRLQILWNGEFSRSRITNTCLLRRGREIWTSIFINSPEVMIEKNLPDVGLIIFLELAKSWHCSFEFLSIVWFRYESYSHDGVSANLLFVFV